MTALIQSQIGVIAVMTYCGLASYMIYDFFTLFIERFVRKSKAAEIALRLLCYTAIGILATDFSMYCQNGNITFTGAACFAAGIWLWRKFFCDIMNPKSGCSASPQGRDTLQKPCSAQRADGAEQYKKRYR